MKGEDLIALGAIGFLVAVVVLLLILPQEIAITAVFAFAATFSGVFLSLELARRRKDQEEKDQFTRLVRAIKMGNLVNDGLLIGILRDTEPGRIPVLSLQTETLQTAMSDPRFYRWANQSLVHITAIVRTDLATLNNLLISYRDAIVGGRTFGPVPVEKLKITAGANLERLRVLHGLLDEAVSVQPIVDTKLNELYEILNKITHTQNERFKELSKTQLE